MAEKVVFVRESIFSAPETTVSRTKSIDSATEKAVFQTDSIHSATEKTESPTELIFSATEKIVSPPKSIHFPTESTVSATKKTVSATESIVSADYEGLRETARAYFIAPTRPERAGQARSPDQSRCRDAPEYLFKVPWPEDGRDVPLRSSTAGHCSRVGSHSHSGATPPNTKEHCRPARDRSTVARG